MEDKKEYLSEEEFQKNKKKIINISVIVLIVGVLVGVALIVVGVMKGKNYTADTTNQRTEVEIKADIDTYEEELRLLEQEEKDLMRESSDIFMEDQEHSDRYYAKIDEADEKREEANKVLAKINTLEMELPNSFTDSFNTQKGKFDKIFKTQPYYMFGTFIILTSVMLAGGIYFFAKRREITAFTTQQVMPVAQEGVEKMAPSIGKVGEEVAKGVAKAKEEKE